MEFKALNYYDCEQVRIWRNQCLYSLRTPFELTIEMQQEFYKNVVCDRKANARYWAIYDGDKLVGMTGLENIEYINRRAEISLIINPDYHDRGYGSEAFEMLLDKGFNQLGLNNIWGECYESNPAIGFWRKMILKYGGYSTTIIETKFFNGKFHDSLWFSFT